MKTTTALVLLLGLVVAACSTKANEQATACTADGKECQSDAECCTKYCQLQSGDKAYCQVDHGGTQCSADRGPCTEDRHCCEGLCLDRTCVGGGSTCLRTSAACVGSDSCCSGYCVNGTCQPPPQNNSGSCSPEGAPCTKPADCCVGFCAPDAEGALSCLGHPSSGGGGGGTNCGATNAFCRSNFDCCSQSCQESASSGACR